MIALSAKQTQVRDGFKQLGKLEDELLDREEFETLKEAKVQVEDSRVEYNRLRPHGSLKYMTPAAHVGTGHPDSHKHWDKDWGQVTSIPRPSTAIDQIINAPAIPSPASGTENQN